jgi:hypothetical protein
MEKIITVKDMRKIIPLEVPTDIVTCIEPYLYSEIKYEAGKLYDDLIGRIINPYYVSKKKFIRRMVELFIDVYGSSFKDFLDKYSGASKENKIFEQGSDIVNKLSSKLTGDLHPTNDDDNIWGFGFAYDIVQEQLSYFTWGTLETFGEHEEYFTKINNDEYNRNSVLGKGGEKKIHQALTTYLDSLKNN